MSEEPGRAAVRMCKDFYRHGQLVTPGCGFIGFYKPEVEERPVNQKRSCPQCAKMVTYQNIGDIALIEVTSS
jgi:hypothetical protein